MEMHVISQVCHHLAHYSEVSTCPLRARLKLSHVYDKAGTLLPELCLQPWILRVDTNYYAILYSHLLAVGRGHHSDFQDSCHLSAVSYILVTGVYMPYTHH